LLRCNFLALAVAGLLVCLGGLGCGGSGEPPPAVAAGGESYLHLRTIKSAYMNATRALDRPPQNLEELMPFLKKLADPSIILRSPDDGEEYKILYGVDVFNAQREDRRWPVLAFEQRGKDGMRWVLEVKEARRQSDEDFKKALFPPGYKAPL
jgi:hypothetical protein